MRQLDMKWKERVNPPPGRTQEVWGGGLDPLLLLLLLLGFPKLKSIPAKLKRLSGCDEPGSSPETTVVATTNTSSRCLMVKGIKPVV